MSSPSSEHSDHGSTHLHTKADPNMALYEAQPIAVNTEPGTRDGYSLRNKQFRDRDGNIITDPDRSNPTRPRLERPLDTIRAFEAAIENHHRQGRA
ncbi:hypothetical protein N7495_001915 [Penicillium taxi]|uniref:uncharacterized protein n=1 Tax=Penicillium taxi TaxID=168475 RepID=UPI0025451DB5|nr:uncharacterized protein N7495_001915 [Penicillium taxi]KAJ5909233.1 hypothetical protein N7495_001915 [Penicillium taxi]